MNVSVGKVDVKQELERLKTELAIAQSHCVMLTVALAAVIERHPSSQIVRAKIAEAAAAAGIQSEGQGQLHAALRLLLAAPSSTG